MSRSGWCLAALTALWLAGCASTNQAPGERSISPACFSSRDVRAYRRLDGRNLLVYAPTRSRAYRILVTPPVPGLSGRSLGFDSASGRICGFAGDTLAIADGRGERRHSITRVTPVDAVEAELLVEEFGGRSVIITPTTGGIRPDLEPLKDEPGEAEPAQDDD